MTRADLRKFCKDSCGEVIGSPGSESPLAWDKLLNDSVDELCRATDALFLSYNVDITSGVSVYACLPLYKLKRVGIAQPNGAPNYNLILVKKKWLDCYQPGWEYYDPGSGQPLYALQRGTNVLQIYPAPNYNISQGLTMEGYGYPSTGFWDSDTDECPLPETYHLCVAYGAIMKRVAMGKARLDPTQAQMIQSMYKELRGQLEAHVINSTPANQKRSSGSSQYPMFPVFSGTPWY